MLFQAAFCVLASFPYPCYCRGGWKRQSMRELMLIFA